MTAEEGRPGGAGAQAALEAPSEHHAAGYLEFSRETVGRVGPPCGCPLDHHECGIDLPLPPTLPNLLASRSTWYHLRSAGLLDAEGHLERFLGSQGVAS